MFYGIGGAKFSKNFPESEKFRRSGGGIRDALKVWRVLIMITEEALRYYTLVYYTLVYYAESGPLSWSSLHYGICGLEFHGQPEKRVFDFKGLSDAFSL